MVQPILAITNNPFGFRSTAQQTGQGQTAKPQRTDSEKFPAQKLPASGIRSMIQQCQHETPLKLRAAVRQSDGDPRSYPVRLPLINVSVLNRRTSNT